MDLIRIIDELWRRRIWVVGAVFVSLVVGLSTSYKLPSLAKRAELTGAASSQALIDSKQSAIGDVERDPAPLATRAIVLAQYMSSAEARRAIANRMGLSPRQIAAEGPFSTMANRSNYQSVPAGPRANQLTEEGALYRLVFDAQIELPIVSIYAQAPDAQQAVRLAGAATTVLGGYVSGLDRGVPTDKRITVTTLGQPEGGIVNSSASPILAMLAFLGTLVVLCTLILLASGLVRRWREAKASLEGTPAIAGAAAEAEGGAEPLGDDPIPRSRLDDRRALGARSRHL